MTKTIVDGMFLYRVKFWNFDQDKYWSTFILATDFDDALLIAQTLIKESGEREEYPADYGLEGLWEVPDGDVLYREVKING